MDAPKSEFFSRGVSQESENSRTVNGFDLKRSNLEEHIPTGAFHSNADLNSNPFFILKKDHNFEDSESDEENVEQRRCTSMEQDKRLHQINGANVQHDRYPERYTNHGDGLGTNGLMISLAGKRIFYGFWKEDLDRTISISDKLSIMCQVSENEKLKAIRAMLSGDVLLYFLSHVKEGTSHEEAFNALRSWYNNADKRVRLLRKWQSLKLSEE